MTLTKRLLYQLSYIGRKKAHVRSPLIVRNRVLRAQPRRSGVLVAPVTVRQNYADEEARAGGAWSDASSLPVLAAFHHLGTM